METKKSPLRTLSVLLTVAVLFGVLACLPVGAAETLTEGDFKYTVENGEATITGYTGEGGDVVVPATLGGFPVTVIGEASFNCVYTVTNVELPEGITTIDTASFAGCKEMTSIKLPDSLKYIWYSAFSGCKKLTSIDLPDALEVIDQDVFDDCDGFTSIVIPASVTIVGVDAFYSCENLTHIYCEAPSKPEKWDDGWVGERCNAIVHWGYQSTEEPENPDNPEKPDNPDNPASLGDLNADGDVNANDYMMLKRSVLGTFMLTDEQLAVADINADGTVNANDYMMLKRAVLGTFMLPTA